MMSARSYPGFTLGETLVSEAAHTVHLQVAPPAVPRCVHCQSREITGFGRRKKIIKDMPDEGRVVALVITVRRYRCKNCKMIYSDSIPMVDGDRRMTQRLAYWIWQASKKEKLSNVTIARMAGITEGTVRSVLKAS